MTLDTGENRAPARRMRAMLNRFLRDEEGALIILSLQIFIVMLVCTGIAIDLVRVEERRAVIQNTLDRAALAAASLSQNLDPEFVVQDYLEKAGIDYLDVDPVVEEGEFGEWRRVTIVAKDNMPTIFGPIVGISSLSASGNSQATESIGNVEISLVLDVSGSMAETVSGSKTRIEMLRAAATSFVNSMFDTVQPPTAPDGRLSISVVPYNQQVTLGTRMGSIFNLSTDHTLNTCADVTTLPTNSIAIAPSTELQRTMYGDSFDHYQYSVSTVDNCPNAAAASVLAFANDEKTVTDKIAALTAGGDTAIDVGARWGLALLDPAAQPALTTMIANSWASSSLAGRPLQYDDGTLDVDETAMKVMVLMTDGQNTRTYSTKMAYRTGTSNFYSTKSNTTFSTATADKSTLFYHVTSRTSDPYYRFSDGTWVSALPKTIYPITWQTIWSKGMTLQTVIDTFLYPPRYKASKSTTKAGIYAEMAIQSEYATKDTALNEICTTAKADDRNIVIFTVAVDAPTAGASILKKCATADTYAYDVTSAGLTDAFASIASAINSLRLSN